MAAARISPAANLLRKSKLFALPPAIALPPIEPSSLPVPRSDTATTIYPTRPAIATTYDSVFRGDWGLKRPLPLKSTTRSNDPVIRLNDGIDTSEHVADFDSAADHVLTLKKFQELNQSLSLPVASDFKGDLRYSAFQPRFDNTTNTSPTAPAHTKYTGVWPNVRPLDVHEDLPTAIKETLRSSDVEKASDVSGQFGTRADVVSGDVRRWRYEGPSLVQMSGYEFDRYVQKLDAEQRARFRAKVRDDMIQMRRAQADAKARDEGLVGEVDTEKLTVSEEEVEAHIRRLRQSPKNFGPLLAEFLDLPDGPESHRSHLDVQKGGQWEYGRDTKSSEFYGQVGPPRTHPSAGLSYIHSNRYAPNHAVFGPQEKKPVVARVIKTKVKGARTRADFGLAGFIVQGRTPSRNAIDAESFNPDGSAQKTAVVPADAQISETGALQMATEGIEGWEMYKERAVHYSMNPDTGDSARRPSRGYRVSRPSSRIGNSLPARSAGPTYRQREPSMPDQNVDDALKNFITTTNQGSTT